MYTDSYSTEKWLEFQQAELEQLDRKGAFVKYDGSSYYGVTALPRNVRLVDILYGFFRKRRSRRNNSM
ncbi:hypothetical protein MNQ98_17805 [Paenibacillus sp. N3/727]|uniref:hypothetical protein n=1 Tax=Paenibacillus sp. N3/727 TaxID=2925845 RepID=UPI001F533B5D|nr:hypothetical protein [Paenibacillus sp. N3/727]UNK16369.1 hypothetical protein MNQ98_17805 [Paenibacillus sp. N3/727]